MLKRRAELVDANGVVVATFNQTCHDHGTTAATVRLHGPLSPLTLKGTESLALYAKGIPQPVLSVEASDPAGTQVHEFHGTSMAGCVPDGTGVSLVQTPGAGLGTLLIVLATGVIKSA